MEMVEAERWSRFYLRSTHRREDVVLISANFGLGESVVSGAVEPDEYSLDYWYEYS